jgi:hypothetical protein
MTLHLNIERGVPLPTKMDETTKEDLLVKARAAAAAADLLAEHGLDDPEPTQKDLAVASALTTEYAKNPEKTSRSVTTANIAKTTPAALRMTERMLDDFGHAIVKSSVQVRNYVTNKLLEETDNPDPRIRIKALEMLGKITDVGLFTERSEVTVTHQSTDDLRDSLRKKLSRMKDVTASVEDADIVED